jgi:hydroxymethylbilane synthase
VAQLLRIRPDLDLMSLRGNVDTRLRKLESGELEAIVLASAGLRRLGMENRISHHLSTEQILPAVGQGALGLEMRRDKIEVLRRVSFLNHRRTEVAVKAERAFQKKLEGGCQIPIAALAQLAGEIVHLTGMVSDLDGVRVIRDEITGHKDRAEEMGAELAGRMLEAGADRILSDVYGKA